MEPKLEFEVNGVIIKITVEQARKLRDQFNDVLGDGYYPTRPFSPQIPWDGPPPYPPTPWKTDRLYRD